MPEARFGWLVSYPKSGNTWLRMMLSSLLAGGAAVDINQSGDDIGVSTFAEMDEFLGVESSELTREEIASAQPGLHAALLALAAGPLLLRKVHDRYWHTPSGEAVFDAEVTRGVVYLIRDPRDVAVSYAHHRGLPLDRTIDIMADPEAALASSFASPKRQLPQPVGSWSGHVTSWLEQSRLPVLVLRYEDLREDPEAGLDAAAAALGIPATGEGIRAAVQATRFEVLRAQERTAGFRERRPESTAPFFRSGSAGGWVHALSSDQQARLVQSHQETMKRFQYI